MKEEKDKEEEKESTSNAAEPQAEYGKKTLHIFKSFEEQEEFDLKYMVSLTPIETLTEMRKFINLAYGMHGFDPENLPKKHTIKIVSYKGKPI